MRVSNLSVCLAALVGVGAASSAAMADGWSFGFGASSSRCDSSGGVYFRYGSTPVYYGGGRVVVYNDCDRPVRRTYRRTVVRDCAPRRVYRSTKECYRTGYGRSFYAPRYYRGSTCTPRRSYRVQRTYRTYPAAPPVQYRSYSRSGHRSYYRSHNRCGTGSVRLYRSGRTYRRPVSHYPRLERRPVHNFRYRCGR